MSNTQSKPKSNKIAVSLLSCVILASGLFITSTLFSVNMPVVDKLQAAVSLACANSNLWSDTKGYNTERLTDFSRAGYMAGEKPIPTGGKIFDVTKYGAISNDGELDSAAFTRAVDAATRHAANTNDLSVVFVPEGEYLLRKPIRLLQSNMVLRGAGTSKTTLRFQESLTTYCNRGSGENSNWITDQTCADEKAYFEVVNEENDTDKQPFKQSKGFIQLGDDTVSKMTGGENIRVDEDAERGDKTLVVRNASGFTPGQWVVLSMEIDDTPPTSEDSLIYHLLSGDPDHDVSSLGMLGEKPTFVNKIASIDGNTLTLALPLNMPVRQAWKPRLHNLDTSVSNVGIENVKIVFPFTKYVDQKGVEGYNAIHFNSVTNGWASHVAIHNTDNALTLNRTAFITLKDIRLSDSLEYYDIQDKMSNATKSSLNEARDKAKELIQEIKNDLREERGDYTIRSEVDRIPDDWLNVGVIRGRYSGHHGIGLGRSFYTLLENSTFYDRHNIYVSGYASMNVFSHIKSFDLRLDHHRRAPHNNLYTDIDTGLGTLIWRSGGNWDKFGPHAGAYNTYWNIRRYSATGAERYKINGTDKVERQVPLPVDQEQYDMASYFSKDRIVTQNYGLKLNFVFNTDWKSKQSADNSWIVQDKKNLCTPNLYEAMKTYSLRTRGNEPPSIF